MKTMPNISISASIPEEDKLALAEIAEKTNRSQNQHIVRAIHDHVERERQFIAMVEEGQNATEFADHSNVREWLSSWGTDNELEPPKLKRV